MSSTISGLTAKANTGAGTDELAVDVVDLKNVGVLKLLLGDAGVNGGFVGSDNPMPVSLASVPSHAVTNAGTFVTQENGAALTSLQLIDDVVYSEDSAHVSGDKGVFILAVRRDADTEMAPDGDYHPLTANSIGRLKVSSLPAAATAQTGSFTASGQSIAVDVSTCSNVCVYVTGTFSALNFTFEASIDGGTSWFTVQAVRSNANTVETSSGSISAAPAYAWECSVNAYTNFRVRSTAMTSGTANIVILPGVYATEPVIATQTTPVTISSGTVTTVTNITNQGHLADNAAFTDGTTRVMMAGYILDETAGTALTENDGGASRIDSKRAQVIAIEDATTRGQRMAVNASGAAAMNFTHIGGNAVATSSGASSSGTQRTILATDSPGVNPMVRAQTTVTRPANTTAYAAGDCWSDSTSAPTSGGFTLSSVAKASGGGGVIMGMSIVSTNAPATVLQAEIWIADSAVTNINDNSAFSLSDSDALKIIAKVPFALSNDGVNNGQAFVSNLWIPYVCSGSANLRFLIKVLNAYTPASAEQLTVTAWGQEYDS